MFRTVGDQPTLWESILPAECLGLPLELERVDRLLDDPAFFDPVRPHFDPLWGRPSIPMETYLRLKVVAELNSRPREVLNWQTPLEVFTAASVAMIA